MSIRFSNASLALLDPMARITPPQVGHVWQRLRDGRPVIHCITNSVVQNFTANLLLSVGVTPSMSTDKDEIKDFVQSADGLLVNLGTLDGDRKQAIGMALESLGPTKSFVLDPVFVNRSPSRLAFARSLISAQPAIVRCNQAEADVLGLSGNAPEKTVLALSGATDRIITKDQNISLGHGHPYGALVTGGGCALSGLMSALLAVEEDAVLAATTAFAAYGIAQEIAAQDAEGPSSFAMRLIDALHHLSADRLCYDLQKMEQA
jgi:hydroxyethylthiazole kinase